MDKFHGTPMGGTRAESARVLHRLQALVSYRRPDDIAVVCKWCAGFLLDHGGYSDRDDLNATVDEAGYYAWIEEYYRHPAFRGFIAPDNIGGTEEENDAMLERIPAHLRAHAIPVWHCGQSPERARRLAESFACISLGGHDLVEGGLKSVAWWKCMMGVFPAICDEKGRPLARIHGLKILDRKIFIHLPLASGDSSNAARNSIVFYAEQHGDDPDDPYPDLTRPQKADKIIYGIENAQSASYYDPERVRQQLIKAQARVLAKQLRQARQLQQAKEQVRQLDLFAA